LQGGRCQTAGATTIPGGFPGATVLIHDPIVAAQEIANGGGDILFQLFVPRSASGLTVWIQAAEPGTCELSNPVQVTFD
jgi:hypothetical protein